jgi:hypothetical protein
VKARIASLAGVACAAAALALAAPALAAQGSGSTRPAVSGTEHFQLLSTSATSTTAPVIAYGVFTAPAIDHMGVAKNVDKFVFSNGSFKVRHRNGTGGTHSFNPRTCLAKITQPGTYTIFGGTGKYAGITGHGKFVLNLLFIGAKSGGKCTQRKPPVAFQQVIRASGPVTL